MENIIQLLAIVLPIIAASSVILVVCLNLYFKIRRKFLVKVNCWFCNQWTKVNYDEQNCFECPTCLQYNGFSSDGDYNMPIPAQHDEMLNQQVSLSKTVSNYSTSNGLCHLCNNNQRLRVYQLAHFVPLNEANFDVEIEHFQKQLDKAYKLCAQCEKVVKNTIRKQNCLLGLKLSKLRKKGVQLLDLDKSHDGISKTEKWLFLQRLISFTLIAFALINLAFVVTKLDFSDKSLKRVTPKWMLLYVSSARNTCVLVSNVIEQIGLNFMESIHGFYQWIVNTCVHLPIVAQIYSYIRPAWKSLIRIFGPYLIPTLPQIPLDNTFLCGVGSLLQFLLLMLWSNTNNFKSNLLQFCTWASLVFINCDYVTANHFKYTNIVQIAATIIIIVSMCFTWNSKSKKQKKAKHGFKKLDKFVFQNKPNESLDDFSDNEELENSFSMHNSTLKSRNIFGTGTATSRCSASDVTFQSTIKPAGILRDNLNKTKQLFCDTNSTARDSLNQSFTSAKSCISDQTTLTNVGDKFNDSFSKHNSTKYSDLDLDIDVSLNKLHLGNPAVKNANSTNAFYINSDANRPRPVISPPKLRNVTQNSWVAGGFWRDVNGILMPISNCSNLSRSSSQTSGFVSQAGAFDQNHFNSLPSSVNNSLCGDIDCNSYFSEPLFDLSAANAMQNRNFNPCYSRIPCQNDIRRYAKTYNPILNNEQLVYISPNYTCTGVYNVCLNKNVLNNSGSPSNHFHQEKKFF